MGIFELSHEKTNNLHYAKTKTQISFAVAAKLISAFVFTIWIVHILFFLNPKFQASSLLLCLYSSVCVRPVQKSHCWFSHETAHLKKGTSVVIIQNEPCHEKTNNMVFEKIRHKQACRVSEEHYRLEILYLENKGVLLSV